MFYTNRLFMRYVEKNVQPDRPQTRVIYGAEGMKQYTLIFSTYCFYTAIIVTRKRLNVTL